MAKSYRLERANLDDKWDGFVRSSPDGSVFFLSAYLSNTGVRSGLYYCLNTNEPRAIVALVESEDGSSAYILSIENSDLIAIVPIKILAMIGSELTKNLSGTVADKILLVVAGKVLKLQKNATNSPTIQH